MDTSGVLRTVSTDVSNTIPTVILSDVNISSKQPLYVYEQNIDEILRWVNQEISCYELVVKDLSSFVSGEVLLALVHRLSPSLFDYGKFDKTDPISTMATTFLLAKEVGIPIFLKPDEVYYQKDLRALLMYITLLKIKIEENNRPPIQVIKNEIGQLVQLVADSVNNVNQTQDQFVATCSKLNTLERIPGNYQEEIEYFQQRANLMDEVVKQSFKVIEDLDQKNDRLYEENKLLNEKINLLKFSVIEEQFSRKKAEEILGIEQKILALGNILDSEGHSVEYYVNKFQDEKL